ncbi:hypothetical protein C8J57DRAFT_1251278 [Mycena rebaudengoi]|nr:hypothetical protein C8J57DRAFT_1251278 [Mycena rebaudengoi]
MYLKYTCLLMYLTYTCNILAWYMLEKEINWPQHLPVKEIKPHLIAPTKVPEESLIALVDPPIGYSWDNLYDGSIWFKLLSQFNHLELGMLLKNDNAVDSPNVTWRVPWMSHFLAIHWSPSRVFSTSGTWVGQLSELKETFKPDIKSHFSMCPACTNSCNVTHAKGFELRGSMRAYGKELSKELMAHFEIKLAAPTVEFKVPLLNLIANKDTGAEPEKAIVQMNALVLGAYIYFPEGLAQFQKLTEEDENRLSADMEDVGAHHPVSVQEDTMHEQYYYLHFHYYLQSETLKEDINSSQDMLQDTQQELHLLQVDLSKANRQGTISAEVGRGVESDPQYPTSESSSRGGMGALLKMGMGSWAVQVEAFVQSHSELDQMTEEEEDEAQWDAVKGSSLSEGEGEVMPDQ